MPSLACLVLLASSFCATDPNVLAEFDIGTDEGPIVVPVTIAGKQYPFLLDTGATYSGYDRSLKPFMGKTTHSEKLLTPAGWHEMELVLPPEAYLGTLPLPRTRPATVDDFDRFQTIFGLKLYGTIGIDFLRAYVVRIDFDRGKLTIFRKSPADSGVAFPCPVHHAPSVELDVLGFGPKEVFLVDTGCVGLGCGNINETLYAMLAQRGRMTLAGKSFSETAAGRKSEEVGILDRLAIGDWEHRGMPFMRGNQYSCLGLYFWARYTTTFDFPGGVVYLQKNSRHDRPESVRDCSGLQVMGVDGRAILTKIGESSPAAEAGLRVGDEVVSVAGRAVATTNLVVVRRLLSGRGERVELVVQRGGRTKTVTLTLRARGED